MKSSCLSPPLSTSAKFLTQPHSPTRPATIWSGSDTARLFSLLQASPGSPISLVMTQPASTVPEGEHSPCASPTLSLFPRLCPPCLAGEGAVYVALSKDPVTYAWLGLQQPCSLYCSWGPYHPNAISLPSVIQCPLHFLASDLHISWDSVGCSLCSSDWLGVSPVRRGKWALLTPTSPPSSLSKFGCCHFVFDKSMGKEVGTHD